MGEREGWRCWLCDGPVDPEMSVNDPRGPSIDNINARVKGRRSDAGDERLAHRACNTKRGAVTPVIPWAEHLFLIDPAPILPSVERLQRKGGREVVARCPTEADADAAVAWYVDRVARLAPHLELSMRVEPGGGQYLLVAVGTRR